MTTEDTTAPLVLLTTNDPGQCADALTLLLATIPDACALVVIGYGAEATACAWAAAEVVAGNHLRAIDVGEAPGNHADAVNAGLLRGGIPGNPRAVYLVSDDVRVCPGWVGELWACLEPEQVHGMGNRVMLNYDSVGMVVPCTDQTTSRAQRIDLAEGEAAMGLSAYAAERLTHFPGMASAADVVDSCCVLLTAELIADCVPAAGAWTLLDPNLGDWAWPELCMRAADAGHRIVVSEGAYVGRTTLISLGHEQKGNVADRLRFYEKHQPPNSPRIVATVIAPMDSWHNLQLTRACLRRLAPLVDGLVLLVGGNPLAMQTDPEYLRAFSAKAVGSADMALFKRCNGKRIVGVGDAIRRWADDVLGGKLSVAAEVWQGAFDPRLQRNHALRLAEKMGATAVLSIAHDEVLDPKVERKHLERLLSHPNPLVRAWDCGIVYHWDAPTLVREDAPFGHGGSYKGGPHSVRLLRLRNGKAGRILDGEGFGALPDTGPASQRVAALTMRRFRFARGVDRPAAVGSCEGMRVSTYNGDNRVGLHCLVYEGEDPEDVARWLDEVHGLVDEVVLVWTGEWADGDKGSPGAHHETGPGLALAGVAHAHGAVIIHQPLEQDFAKARNAGIDHLAKCGGLRWAWFIDPDEWLKDPLADGVALRNMANSDRWGWLMQIVNYRADRQTPTISDSVRISRLDPENIMRMDGRVHEGFNTGIHKLQAKGLHPRLIYAPFMLQQRGMALSPEVMDAKLVKYEAMLRLELEDSPHNPGAWVSLGWHYFNDGHDAQGLECYKRALACAGNSYLPFKELAYYHLRIARTLMDECDARLVDSHQFAQLATLMRKWLHQYAPPHPTIARLQERPAVGLPDWVAPDTAGRSGYDKA